MGTPAEAVAAARRHRDEMRRAANRAGVPRTPLAVMQAQQAQQALDAAQAALHAPKRAARRELGSVILPGQAPLNAPTAPAAVPQQVQPPNATQAEIVLQEIGDLIAEHHTETATQ